jgi:NAD(P)-dependent dehydrogenase (short-subunit alcohol dehydrogenase family)
MIAQRRGKIVNISSQAAVAALDDHAAYSASKAGLNMLTKAMTVEWAPLYGVVAQLHVREGVAGIFDFEVL